MAIVSSVEVNDHLSSPPWSEPQWASVQRIIDRREADLEAWLGAPITPVQRVERAEVLRSGLVATSGPVHTVHEIDGVAVVAETLPEGWMIRGGHWLAATPGGLYEPTAWSAPRSILIRYDAGWGSVPTLYGAILEKSADIARNRHDDTVTTSGLDAEAPARAPEEWTDNELASLHAYKLARLR